MDLSHGWTLHELADLAAMSGEHLRRLGQGQVGRSPMDHVAHLRRRRAKTLLGSTPMPVADVARSLGYPRSSSFSAAFKRHAGMSPAAYRRRHR